MPVWLSKRWYRLFFSFAFFPPPQGQRPSTRTSTLEISPPRFVPGINYSCPRITLIDSFSWDGFYSSAFFLLMKRFVILEHASAKELHNSDVMPWSRNDFVMSYPLARIILRIVLPRRISLRHCIVDTPVNTPNILNVLSVYCTSFFNIKSKSKSDPHHPWHVPVLKVVVTACGFVGCKVVQAGRVSYNGRYTLV